MKYAYNDNGTLRDVVMTRPSILFAPGYAALFIVVPDETQNGWLWDGETATPPPDPGPVVPAEVTRRQAKQALLLAGLLGNVQTAIDAIEDATERGLVQIEWDDSQVFQRDRPALIGLGTALGLDSAALDQLFITAAGIP